MGIERVLVVEDAEILHRGIGALFKALGFSGEVYYALSVKEMEGKKPADLYLIDGLHGRWKDAVTIALRQNPDAKFILVSSHPEEYNKSIENLEKRGEKLGLRFRDKVDLYQIIEEVLKPA
ncbi:MAG: hypothetical protein V1702_06275 [Candidatus Woesearchaeota archaeon]